MHPTAEVGRRSWPAWLGARAELLVPVLGLLVLRAMLSWQGVHLAVWQAALVYGAAVLYAAIVLRWPMALPVKVPQSSGRRVFRQAVPRW